MNKIRLRKIVVNLLRFITAVVFIFSGFVKAVDPLGTQYKITDYLVAAGLESLATDIVTLSASVLLSAFEFCCGVLMMFAVRRKLMSRLVMAFMSVMTLITLWIAVFNPVSDCGCFGDAIVLGNVETLVKNIFLTLFAAVLCRYHEDMIRFVRLSAQWIVINYTVIFIFAVSLYSLYFLPQFDFRPYHVGADIKKGMEIPEGAPVPEFETTFIMEKNGEKKEFGIENYPDSTWTFVENKTIMTKKGYEPPIHDFSITSCESGEDLTDDILNDTCYVFLLISPYIEKANDGNFGEIDRIYEYAVENNYKFYGVTSSGEDAIERWRDLTGAEYPFCLADAITLKTIIRSNPGLVLLKDGKVVGKWSHNSLPQLDMTAASLEQDKAELGQKSSLMLRVLEMMLWFFIPLMLLTLADRAYDLRGKLKFKRKEKEKVETKENN